jgi:hypothetical protein
MAKLLTGTRVYGTANVDNVLRVGNITPVISTSNSTGSLIVTGGVGVSGNIYVGGTNAGANGIYTDVLRYAANGLPWAMGSASGGGGPAFSRVIVSGQPDAIANIANAPLTLVAGSGMTITTVGTSNTITFSSTGGGASSGYLANSVIFANAAGFLSNTANLQFVSATNTLRANASIVLANTQTKNSASIIYNASLNSIDFIFN